jgi:hypothetical protein
LNNGFRIDPVSGKVWIPPDPRMLHAAKFTNGATIVPTVAGTNQIANIRHDMSAPACADCQWMVVLSGGYAAQRMGSGNFWQVERSTSLYRNGVLVSTTTNQPIFSTENNSGGILGQGAAIEPETYVLAIPAGQTATIITVYQHHTLTFSANAGNGLTWRPPTVDGFMFTLPG